MRMFYCGLAMALLAGSASAQDKKDAAPQSSTSILVNGQPVNGKVLEVDGKHFVAVEDLAQSLRGTLSYGDGQISLTLSQPASTAPKTRPSAAATITAQPALPQASSATTQPPSSQPPPVTAQPPGAGGVKGDLTYFFDFHTGNKPDTGSKVWLVKDRVEIPADQSFVGTSTALGTSANPEQFNALRYSIVDAKGYFEFHDIPPGQYTLILQSAHTKGTLKDKRNLFGRQNHPNLRDSTGRVESLNVVVKAGDTVEASKDFGPTIEQ